MFVVHVDLDAREERARQKPSHVLVAEPIRLSGPSHEPFGLRVHPLDLLSALGQLRKLLLHLVALSADAPLLAGEEVEGNRVGVGHLHELEPLGVESGEACLRPRPLLSVILDVCGELGSQAVSDGLGVDLIEAHPPRPSVLQAPLELRHAEGRAACSRDRGDGDR